jgi:hypothetical protein
MDRIGILCAISGRYCAILGRREVLVLDLLSGRVRWRRRGVSPESVLIGDADAVCLSRMADSGPKAFRWVDGRELPIEQFPKQLSRAFGISGDRLLTAETPFSLFERTVRIAAVSPRLGEADWQQSFPADTLFARGRERELVAIRPDGQISTVDVLSGARAELGRLPASSIKQNPQILTLGDSTRVYIIVNRPALDAYTYLSAPSLRANGELFAFDRDQPGSFWRRPVRASNFVISQLERMPVVLLAGYRTDERNAGPNSLFIQQLELRALDKRTGEEVLGWSGAITGGSPTTIRTDVADRRIDVMSYNERFRIQFPPPTSEAN